MRVQREAVEHFVAPVVPDDAPEKLSDRPFTFDDPLWEIVGIIDDDGPTDISINADRYLADAYPNPHDE